MIKTMKVDLSVVNEETGKLTPTTEMITLTSEQEAEFLASMPSQSVRELASLREVRDRLISETDWWASSDLTMTAEQTTYRQALRDITESYSSLTTVVWPTKP
jgi:hypothetical protein